MRNRFGTGDTNMGATNIQLLEGWNFPRRRHIGKTVGVRSMENKKILPHTNKQAKIYLLDCSNESIE